MHCHGRAGVACLSVQQLGGLFVFTEDSSKFVLEARGHLNL